MATVGTLPISAKRTATDTVMLGRSKMEVTRLAFGTGTDGGAVQAGLGQQEFTRLVRYAYDHGIRFFETAEAYQTRDAGRSSQRPAQGQLSADE